MKRFISSVFASAMAFPAVFADLESGECPMYAGGYGMMGGGYGFFGYALLWLLFIAVAAFVFALIFWGTKKLFENSGRKRGK